MCSGFYWIAPYGARESFREKAQNYWKPEIRESCATYNMFDLDVAPQPVSCLSKKISETEKISNTKKGLGLIWTVGHQKGRVYRSFPIAQISTYQKNMCALLSWG